MAPITRREASKLCREDPGVLDQSRNDEALHFGSVLLIHFFAKTSYLVLMRLPRLSESNGKTEERHPCHFFW